MMPTIHYIYAIYHHHILAPMYIYIYIVTHEYVLHNIKDFTFLSLDEMQKDKNMTP